MKRHWLWGLFTAILMMTAPAFAAPDLWVYFGTYTADASPSDGIYVAGFDSASGQLGPFVLAGEAVDPSFTALHPTGRYLYAVSESGSSVSSFAINASNGKLTLLNSKSSEGSGACHVTVDASGKTLLMADYDSGRAVSFPIQSDGMLGDAVSIYHQGPPSRANPDRQEEAHAHCFSIDPANRFAFSCDLGCDRIFSYRLEPATAKLIPNVPPFASVPPGGGPRHLAFHPGSRFAYANNEITCTVTSFTYEPEKGVLTPIETISTLPQDTVMNTLYSTAEIEIHPSGKFLYVSNRGFDTLAVFDLDEATGKLQLIDNTPAMVKTPRCFGIDPSGRWLIAAGQDSNTVVVFSINPSTGRLTLASRKLMVGAPVCVMYLKR